jgi:hypothetical protein
MAALYRRLRAQRQAHVPSVKQCHIRTGHSRLPALTPARPGPASAAGRQT